MGKLSPEAEKIMIERFGKEENCMIAEKLKTAFAEYPK